MHIYSPFTVRAATLTIGRSAYFAAMTSSRLEESTPAYKFPVIQCFRWVSANSYLRKFADCLKPPSRENHRKASYQRGQQRDQGED